MQALYSWEFLNQWAIMTDQERQALLRERMHSLQTKEYRLLFEIAIELLDYKEECREDLYKSISYDQCEEDIRYNWFHLSHILKGYIFVYR